MKSDKKFALLRIAFGIVWAIDAWFKWQPTFLGGLVDQLTSMLAGQPAWIQSWIGMWISLVKINPHLFAVGVAVIETLLAIGLIFGLCTRATLIVGITFSLIIWSVAEGFGGPYAPGSTDIGCAIMYAFVAVALLFGESWKAYSLDALRVKGR